MKTLNHIVHLRLKEKPLPNSMSSGPRDAGAPRSLSLSVSRQFGIKGPGKGPQGQSYIIHFPQKGRAWGQTWILTSKDKKKDCLVFDESKEKSQ